MNEENRLVNEQSTETLLSGGQRQEHHAEQVHHTRPGIRKMLDRVNICLMLLELLIQQHLKFHIQMVTQRARLRVGDRISKVIMAVQAEITLKQGY